jgi:hypothetical protein
MSDDLKKNEIQPEFGGEFVDFGMYGFLNLRVLTHGYLVIKGFGDFRIRRFGNMGI